MSERVDWRAIAGWSTCVAIQVGKAIYDWMTTRNVRDLAYYQKMAERFEMKCRESMRDESMGGFRIWLISDRYRSGFDGVHTPIQPPLPMDGNWEEWAKEEPTSVLMVVKCPIPNERDRQLIILRRYSLINAKINVNVARVSYGYGWYLCHSTHLDDRTVALLFEREDDDDLNQISTMMVMIDVQQRSQWQFEIPSHHGDITHVSRGGSRGNRVRIVYVRRQPQSEIIITSDYDLIQVDNDPSRLIAVESGQQSITFPNRRFSKREDTWGMPFAAAMSLQGVQGASDLIVCIDARGDLHGWPKDEWEENFRESNFGQRLSKAGNDFLPVYLMGVLMFRFFLRHKYMLAVANNVYYQRPLSVPSMGRLAADAICRARPDADFSMLEDEIGFDIFDGIIRDQEKPVLTTTLP